MQYTELANEFLQNMYGLNKLRAQKQISNSMQGEPFILQYIAFHDGNAIPSEISNEMNISTARVATVLNSLENKGLITRQIDSGDRRRTILKLTSAGEEQVDTHNQTILKSTIMMFEFLGDHDAKEYTRIIGRLAEMAPCDNE